ncbi:hypothetical protein Efla_002255 [Eimeria flavescens]
MKRAKRRGEGPPSASEGPLGGREFDAEFLYKDDNDKKASCLIAAAALESMNEFQREAELARRYEEVARERQRAELLSNARDKKDGRLEALSDIRARRARMKQLQSKASDSSSHDSGEEGEIREREGSEMDFTSETEAAAASAEAETPLHSAAAKMQQEEPLSDLKSTQKKRLAVRAEEGGDANLFAEERIDGDERRRRELSRRMLDRLSLDLLNRVRLSTATVHHMLEHPQAEAYLTGCFVKVPPPAAAAAAAAVTDAFVCQIVGIRPCMPYTLRIDGRSSSCCHHLLLRPTPKASSKYDREFSLTDLVDAPATQREFEGWMKKLQQFETVENLAKKMKAKIAQLEKFTFTDEDVQQILLQKESASAAAAQTRGGLIKQALGLKHQISSLVASLSSPSTASSQRKDIRESLALLLQKKAAVEAQLAKLTFDPLATSSSSSSSTPVGLSRTDAAHRMMAGSKRRGFLIGASRPLQSQANPQANNNRPQPVGTRGFPAASGLESLAGLSSKEQTKAAAVYMQLRPTGPSLAASVKPQSPPPAAFRGPLMIGSAPNMHVPPHFLVISLEEYKRQVAQLASMQLNG